MRFSNHKDHRRRTFLLVTPFPYDGVGGVAVAVQELTRAFRGLGNDVFVLARGTSNHVQNLDTFPESVFGLNARTPGQRLRTWISWFVFFPLVTWSLWRFMASSKIDAVFIQYPGAQFFYFGLLRKVCRWKLIVTFQGNDAHDLNSYSQIDRFLIGLLLKNADCVTAVASSLMVKVNRAFFRLKGSQAIIPNGARYDTDCPNKIPFDLPGDYLITVGNLIPRKGVDTILHALGLLKQSGEEVNLVVVGDGPELTKLKMSAQVADIVDSVYFLGVQSHEMTIELIKRSTVFILASREEGLPLVVVEAMMSGKPVIATAVDGTPDIVEHDHTGLLIPPDRPDVLARSIRDLIVNRQKRVEFGKAGRVKAQRYNWSRIAADYMALHD